MVYEVGDIVKLKKPHPCGSQEWEILRVGADFRPIRLPESSGILLHQPSRHHDHMAAAHAF